MLFDITPLLRRLIPGLLAGSLLGHALTAAAEQETRWYDVEVILFNQTSQQFRDSELWPIDIALPEMEAARSLLPATKNANPAAPVPFTLLSHDQLTLGAEAERIKKAPELELLLHLGWRQPGLPEEEAVSVQVYDGMLHGAPSRIETNTGGSAGVEAHRMEGTLKLVLSRYLHISADLLYREPLPQESAYDMLLGNTQSESASLQTTAGMTGEGSEPAPFGQAQGLFDTGLLPRYRVYRMQQSRRMRSTEMHYLDHPVLGMIIRVNPYELPKSETASQESTAGAS